MSEEVEILMHNYNHKASTDIIYKVTNDNCFQTKPPKGYSVYHVLYFLTMHRTENHLAKQSKQDVTTVEILNYLHIRIEETYVHT